MKKFPAFGAYFARSLTGLIALLAVSIAISDLIGRRVEPEFPSPAVALSQLSPQAREYATLPCSDIDPGDGTGFLKARSNAPASGQDAELQDYACLGYLNALERGWQMDHFRRIAWGRVSERDGPAGIKRDVQLRLMGLGNHARRLLSELAPASRTLLEAYAAGVNAALLGEGRADEAKSRSWDPPRAGWRPVDSVILLLLQAFDQTRKGFTSEIDEEQSLAVLGRDHFNWFPTDQMPWDASVLKPGEYIKQAPGKRKRKGFEAEQSRPRNAGGARPPLPTLRAPERNGSNNWVISPSRAGTRHAWLANDPHLDLTDPPFWHPVRFSGNRFMATGFMFPGIPIFASGTNGKVAWGLTNSYLDTADLMAVPDSVLKASEAPVSETEWAFIPVRLGLWRMPLGPIPLKRFGPRLPALPVEVAGVAKNDTLVLRWSGFHLRGSDLDPLFALIGAGSVREASERLAKVGLPSWNYVLADRKGHIGYRAMGLVPRREAQPVPGILRLSGAMGADPAKWDWQREDFLPPDEIPNVEDPARGWVVTANARQWPSDSLLHGGRAYAQGFRGFRIEELLAQSSRLDLAAQRRIQCDIQAVDARFLLPLLLDITLGEDREVISKEVWSQFDGRTRSALESLLQWDYLVTPGCRSCGIYRLWISRIQANLGGVDEPYLFRLFSGLVEEISEEPVPQLRRPASRSVIAASLQEALDELESWRASAGGEDKGRSKAWPTWEELHRAPFPHIGGASRALQQQSIATPGDEHTVNPGSADWREEGFVHRAGASMRMIVELSDPVQVHAVLAGPRTARATREARLKAWEAWRDCHLEKVE